MTVGKRKPKSTKNASPIWLWIILAILVVVGIVYVSMPKSALDTGKMAAEVSVEEAAKLRDQGAFILDVREQSEWVQFHIPGATLVPLGSLPQEFAKVPKDKTIVVVCRTGNRSAQGRGILQKAGYQNVTSMAGGVTEWQAKGLPIETGE
jgi:rhodanese-related sulfurtransferase